MVDTYIEDFIHTDGDGDTLKVQLGAHSAVFTAHCSDTHEQVRVAVHPEELSYLIAVLQAMQAEMQS